MVFSWITTVLQRRYTRCSSVCRIPEHDSCGTDGPVPFAVSQSDCMKVFHQLQAFSNASRGTLCGILHNFNWHYAHVVFCISWASCFICSVSYMCITELLLLPGRYFVNKFLCYSLNLLNESDYISYLVKCVTMQNCYIIVLAVMWMKSLLHVFL